MYNAYTKCANTFLHITTDAILWLYTCTYCYMQCIPCLYMYSDTLNSLLHLLTDMFHRGTCTCTQAEQGYLFHERYHYMAFPLKCNLHCTMYMYMTSVHAHEHCTHTHLPTCACIYTYSQCRITEAEHGLIHMTCTVYMWRCTCTCAYMAVQCTWLLTCCIISMFSNNSSLA